ncbi:MAG: tetratricopeptide repeat protein [Bacteroidota bacterium]
MSLLFACSAPNESIESGPSQAQMKNAIDSIETFLFEKTNGLHEPSMKRLKDAYLAYADTFPDDKLSADYCFRAANMARGLKTYPEAISIYQRILDNYPDSKNYVDSHFMMAVVYDNDLKDKLNAKKVYAEVAQKYPDHKFGKDAQALLDNKMIDLSDEDLVKFLEEKNKEQVPQ